MTAPLPVSDRRVVELREYETRIVHDVHLTAGDRRILDDPAVASCLQLRALDQSRLEVRAGAHIGVLSLDALDIHIAPKLIGTNLDVLRMAAYTADTTALHHLDNDRTMATGGPHLRDLICRLLARTCERLLQGGLRHDYLNHTRALPALRGRLLVDRQLLRRHGRLDLLECRYDEHSTDIPDNQLCAAALTLAARTATDPAVRAMVRRLATDFTALCDPTALPAETLDGPPAYGRHNSHYRPAHHWARLLLAGNAIRDFHTPGTANSQAFFLDMNTLFEDFVTRLTVRALTPYGITVHPQRRHRGILVHEHTATTHSEVIPDLLLTTGHGPTALRHPVDAKYKLYADRKLSTPDLYQAFLYAHALASEPDPPDPPRCTILYPGPPNTPPRTVVVRTSTGRPTARVTALPLNVPAILGHLAAGHEQTALRPIAEWFNEAK